MGVPRPKLIHGFSPNFEDMLTETGSTAEWVLDGIGHLLPWEHFKYFSVLNLLIEKGVPLNRCYYSCVLISCWPRPGLGDYETASIHACMCVCMRVCVCHIFKSSFIFHSVMKISSPNLQRMFMAVKTCSVKNDGTHLKKKHGRHSALLENHWS